jgi:hypothetical protein
LIPAPLSARWGNPSRDHGRIVALTPDGKLEFSYGVRDGRLILTFPGAITTAAKGRFVKPGQKVRLQYEVDPRVLIEQLREFIEVVVPFFLAPYELERHATSLGDIRLLRA